MKRLHLILLATFALCLVSAAPAFAFSPGSRSGSSADANNRVKVWVKIEYNYVKIPGTLADYGVQFTKCSTKWTSLNSAYYVAFIDLSCGGTFKGNCSSTGGSLTNDSHTHSDSWRVPSSRAPTVGLWYNYTPGFSGHYNVVSVGSGFYIHGRAVARIYNKNSGASAGTASCTVTYSGGS